MRQSLAQIEREFEQATTRERHRRENLRAEVHKRSHNRHRRRTVKHQNLRFLALLLAIIGTAIVVAVAMLETLSWLMS